MLTYYELLELLSFLMPHVTSEVIAEDHYSRDTKDNVFQVHGLLNELRDAERSKAIKKLLESVTNQGLTDVIYGIPEISEFCNSYRTNIDEIISLITNTAAAEAARR